MGAIIVGAFALTMALALWLGEMLCSATLAWVIVGVLLLAIAVIIYFVSLHKTIRRINRRLDTVYEVSATLEALYQQAMMLIRKVVSSWKWLSFPLAPLRLAALFSRTVNVSVRYPSDPARKKLLLAPMCLKVAPD